MSYHKRVIVHAPGKINLTLQITGIAANGYHLLESVMHSFGPGDLVTLEMSPEYGNISVSCSRNGVPEDNTNIAHKAATAFFASAGIGQRGLHIHIEKIIPPEAGLGGGSANAAAVLRGLNVMFGASHSDKSLSDKSLSDEALREIGSGIGADVPFCITGGCALAQGIGDKLTALPMLEGCYIAIAKPPGGMSTALAYRLYDEKAGVIPKTETTAAMIDNISRGDIASVGKCMSNVFEHISGRETARIKSAMMRAGAVGAVLSGSGSAVAGLFPNEQSARECLTGLTDCEILLATPVKTGAVVVRVE